MKYILIFFLSTLTNHAFSESMPEYNRKYCENLDSQIILLREDTNKELSGQSNNQQPGIGPINRQPGIGPAYKAKMEMIDKLENEYKLKCAKTPVGNAPNIKR